jgi:hypothetical protein
MDAFKEFVPLGSIVKTSYNTGPFRVVKILGPSTEPSYHDWLDFGEDGPPSRPHYNLLCVKADDPPGTKAHSYLNGYELREGRILSVWMDHEIFMIGQATEQQALF